MDKLKENKKIANATHNIIAYRISTDDKAAVYNQDCFDDGEIHAGSRMLHLLQVKQLVLQFGLILGASVSFN